MSSTDRGTSTDRVRFAFESSAISCTDVRDVTLDRDAKRTGYVSPANSRGDMDGGIDYTLSRIIFPGVEARVKAAIAAQSPTLCSNGSPPRLAIGKAVVVPALDLVFEDPPRLVLIAAPTMSVPQDVHKTHNAYSAMYAALVAAEAAGVDRPRHSGAPSLRSASTTCCRASRR